MNKVLIGFIGIAMSLFMTQCSNNSPSSVTQQTDNENRSFGNLTSDVLIDLPQSMAVKPATKLGKASTTADPAKDIYDGIRAYIGFANYIVNDNVFGVKAMICFWRDTLNWKYIKEVGSMSGTNGNLKWTASYDSTQELAYKLIVNRNDITGEPVVLKIDFNGRFVIPKGKVYYNVGLFDKSQNDSLKIEVSFDKQIDSRSLNVKLSGCEMKNVDDPQNIDLSLYAKNGIVQVSGSSYHPGMDSIINGVKGHCYTFTGTADPLLDKSVLNLGLPPASYTKNDNALFTTYGIAEMWTSAFIIRDIPKLPDTVKSFIATSYTKNLSLEQIFANVIIDGAANVLVPSSTINTMTVEQFKQFLNLNDSITNPVLRAEINSMLWITELTQPVYFNFLGYVGNGNNVPSGFKYLTEAESVLEPKTPSQTASMTINP